MAMQDVRKQADGNRLANEARSQAERSSRALSGNARSKN
jgi:hypothetical protein